MKSPSRHALVLTTLALTFGCGGSSSTGFGARGDAAASGDGNAPVGDSGVAAQDAADAAATPPGLEAGVDAGHVVMGSDASPPDVGAPVDSGPDAMLPDATLPDAGGPIDAALPHDTGSAPPAIVYGQSAGTLYSVDPTTNAVTTVGAFVGCGAEVIDIALNKSSVMYATSTSGVYTVDPTTVVCTLLAQGTYPNSLSFVPAGTLDPSSEALVGYSGSDYVRIDTTTGALTNVGSLGTTYASSGDIVSVIGGGTYLTVTGGSDCSNQNCLVEVNPSTGALVKNYGSVQHSGVFGLAFWAGNVYGFDSAGDLFEVTFPDAGGLIITTIPIPSPPANLSFYGAGSTTAAPRK